MTITPFVKWAGGKRALSTIILDNCPPSINKYYEPFVGGGAIFLALTASDKVSPDRCYLSDLNKELITTYLIIANKPTQLIEQLKQHAQNHKSDKNYYYKIRSEVPTSLVKIASRFIYLNKTCFNGLYRVNRKGLFNVPTGKYKNPHICDPINLIRLSKIFKKAKISQNSFDANIEVGHNDFVYCDPPYDETYNSYQSGGFSKTSQILLRDMANKWVSAGANVMLSNSDTEFIRDLYKDYKITTVLNQRVISCNASNRKKIPELLITSY